MDQRRQILLVDGDEEMLSVLSSAVSGLGFTATAFADPAKALEICSDGQRQFTVALVSNDLLPMTGTEFALRLREYQPQTRIYLMSGEEIPAGQHMARVAGLAGFLQKPVKSSHLAALLEQ